MVQLLSLACVAASFQYAAVLSTTSVHFNIKAIMVNFVLTGAANVVYIVVCSSALYQCSTRQASTSAIHCIFNSYLPVIHFQWPYLLNVFVHVHFRCLILFFYQRVWTVLNRRPSWLDITWWLVVLEGVCEIHVLQPNAEELISVPLYNYIHCEP